MAEQKEYSNQHIKKLKKRGTLKEDGEIK